MIDPHDLPDITDDLLLAYLEGDASPEVAERIERSAELQKRAHLIGAELDLAKEIFHRSACPDPDRIGDYYLELLPKKETADVHAHLKACPHCTRELAVYRRALGPPETAPGLLEVFKVWVADLADTSQTPGLGQPAFAFRGDRPSLRVYQTEEALVSIDVTEEMDGAFSMQGTVAGPEAGQTAVMLWHAGSLVETSRFTRGSFKLGGLKAGEYELVIRSNEGVFYIASLSVP